MTHLDAEFGVSTIAQLLFPSVHSVDFARTVAELENVLVRCQTGEVRIGWDCDDFVCFDIPGTRIQLAWAEVERRGYGACLTVTVGPAEGASPRYHEDLCSRLVDRIAGRFGPVAVLWAQAEGEFGAEEIDALQEELPHLTPPEAAAGAEETPVDDLASAPKSQAPQLEVANDRPDLPQPRNEELTRVRLALYPQDAQPQPYSTQLRLAVHCMNATLILVWAPMGAAVMTYALLRGEDMRLSARVMAVTGTVLTLAHSPFGASMAAMARTVG